MKRTLLTVLAVLAGAGIVLAEVAVTNVLPAYRMVSATSTNAGDTGLVTGKTYMAFCLDDVAGITEGQAGTTGKFSQVAYALCDSFWSRLQGLSYTNRPASLVWGKGLSMGASNQVTVIYNVRVEMVATNAFRVAE